jgi:hypothetical protein
VGHVLHAHAGPAAWASAALARPPGARIRFSDARRSDGCPCGRLKYRPRDLPTTASLGRRPPMRLFNELSRALQEAGSMTWQITWSLILGFTLSAVVQAVVRREAIARHLGQEAAHGHDSRGDRAVSVLCRRGRCPCSWLRSHGNLLRPRAEPHSALRSGVLRLCAQCLRAPRAGRTGEQGAKVP